MSAKVILTVTSGSLKDQQFEFSDRTICLIGRARDCHLRLPNDKYHLNREGLPLQRSKG